MTMPGRVLAAAIFATVSITPGQAQTPAEFYKGKTVDLQIAYSVGGGYDQYARLVAQTHGQAHPRQSAGSFRTTCPAPAACVPPTGCRAPR